MGNVGDSHRNDVIIGSWASATGGVTISNPGVQMNFATETSVVIHLIEAPGLRSVFPPIGGNVQRLARLSTVNGVTTAQTLGYLSDIGATFGTGSQVGDDITYTLPAVSQSVGVGDVEITSTVTTVNDALYDVNGDGAFDSEDPAWVRANFRSIDTELENPNIVKGNYVVDGAVDEADAVFLESILEKVGPSGIAGDVNSDGVLDCQDSYGALSFFDSQIGQTGYVYALDMNRDGFVDQSDKSAFFILVNQCDFNQDGSVDDGDFVIFTAAYNILDCADPLMPAYCPADLNLDGVVDDADFAIFYVRYNAVTC
ncbi:MAG: hypothetical protein K2Y21_14535 [Phycisphaerales bacterium]|nr:hypothetical protein [Phycisphaerales bacterium]